MNQLPSERIKEIIGGNPKDLDQAVAGIIKYLDEQYEKEQEGFNFKPLKIDNIGM